MASFDPAINLVLSNEGGFIDHPSDPGGATNAGISLRFLKGLSIDRLAMYGIIPPVTVLTIKELDEATIHLIYLLEFWVEGGYAGISSQDVANYVFDMGVNLGLRGAGKVAQRGYNSVSMGEPLLVDGVMGNKTLAAINSLPETVILAGLITQRIKYYYALVKLKPELEVFLKGWLNRANRL